MTEKKIFTKLNELILVFGLLSNFQRPQNNDIAFPQHLLLITPPLHTPLHHEVWCTRGWGKNM